MASRSTMTAALDASSDGGAARQGARMTALRKIVGVDVGGTFTDLFLFDEAQRLFRTAKVPSNRGNEAEGFMQGLHGLGPDRRAWLDRSWHDRRHQHAAWNGAARASA